MHVIGDGHATPHSPQFSGLWLRSTQLLPHWVVPSGQTALQLPAAHTAPGSQTTPHSPQFIPSSARLVHCPLHSVSPA